MRAALLVLLAAATIAAFAGVQSADWILFDDPAYALSNAHISRGFTWEGWRWILTHAHGGNFHPLTSASHMLDAELFGRSPLGPHLLNLALHVANALLVCRVLYGYTRAWWRSYFVAVLFALHPLRVESVAWISERKDVLSLCFFLLALDAYRRWTERRTAARYAIVCALFVLGLCAKPMLVTLPFVLVLLDVWPLRRAAWNAKSLLSLAREKLPLAAISLAASIATFCVQRATGAVLSAEKLALGGRILNAMTAYARYVALWLAPRDLAVYYPLAAQRSIALPIASGAAIAFVTVLAWRERERRPWLAVGWLWFLGTLVPVIGIVQVGGQALADRYTYLSTLGLAIAFVWGAAEIAVRARIPKAALAATCAVIALALGLATARQVALWKDTRTLFTHTLEVTRDNAVAHQVLGNALLLSGDGDAAIVELEAALAIAPEFAEAHNNLGSALGTKQRFDEAAMHFRAALRSSDSAETHHNLGYTLAEMGHADEARKEYEAALAIDRDDVLSNSKLGAMLLESGRFAEALEHFQRTLALAPDDLETRRSSAIARTLQGDVEGGIQDYREILSRSPNDLDALNNIAWIRATHAEARHRNGAEAVRLAEAAHDAAREENAALESTLAAAYAETGRFADATRACEHAIEIARRAKPEQDTRSFAAQLACYRSGRAFHFSP
jgi:tetratricopeptide (TPR) repeat protein